MSFWTDKPRNHFYLPNSSNLDNYFMPYTVSLGLQLLLVLKENPFIKSDKSFFQNIGIQEEIGYSTPYMVEGGLTYKL